MFRAVADSPLSCLDYLFCRSSCFYHRSCRFIHFNAQSSRNPVVEQNPLVFDIFSLPYKHHKAKNRQPLPLFGAWLSVFLYLLDERDFLGNTALKNIVLFFTLSYFPGNEQNNLFHIVSKNTLRIFPGKCRKFPAIFFFWVWHKKSREGFDNNPRLFQSKVHRKAFPGKYRQKKNPCLFYHLLF